MANPAELLHAQLTKWNGPENVAARNTRGIPASQGWEDHRRAVMLLKDIEELLTIAEKNQGLNMSHARRHFDRWTQMVFAYPYGWSSSGQHSIDAASLEQLEATATTLQMVVPEFVDGGPEGFAGFLDAVRDRVDALCDEGEFLRIHAHRIINHLHGLLDARKYMGEFRIANAINDLNFITEELKKKSPKDPFLQQAATNVWSFFKKNIAVAYIAGVAITALPEPDEVLELVATQVREITSDSDESDETDGEITTEDES